MKDTTGAIMAKYLDQEYVKYFFGVPGAHVLPLANYRGSSIKPIINNQEATGYGRHIDQTALFKNSTKKSQLISDKQSGHCRANI
jgi:thiamine pyrophosphate-dependent acetolactate synthase large subunit-like protein